MKIFSARVGAYLWAIALVTLLGACGGGSKSGTTPTPAGGTPAPTASAKLTLAASTNTISATAPATVNATLNDAGGAPVPNALVKFATQGTGFGVFFPTGGTALTNAAGVAVIALNAGTQVGADTVTATATVGSNAVVSAPLGFTVTAAPVTTTPAAISFVSATPTTIAIKGTGGQENSTVIFVVKDNNGNPVANQNVNFAPSTTAGDLTLFPLTGISGTDGQVSTTVRSGTTATPVRVQASLNINAAINAVSSLLVVSTAIPHQDGFSIAAIPLNLEGLDVDGVTTTVTARLSDRYGNLVPDGTAVSFRTEGGVFLATPSCVTKDGACAITLTSSGLRPFDGRLTLLATAIGEESFTDTNGNGLYDPFDPVTGRPAEPFKDLPEAFIDGNENGTRETNEEFVDFNNNKWYDSPDGQFNGVLRNGVLRSGSSLASSTINVRSSLVFVISGSQAVFTGLPSTVNLPKCVDGTPFIPPSQTVNFTIGDRNGNYMAPGTTITFATTNGKITSLPTSITIPDVNARGPQPFSFTVASDATQGAGPSFTCANGSPSGTLLVTVTTPRGLITYGRTTIND